jgi:putative transposase
VRPIRRGGSRTAPTKPLGRLIGAFKTVSTKHINEWRETPSASLWQRDFYEHIIHNDDDLDRIRTYIAANPARWAEEAEIYPMQNSRRLLLTDEQRAMLALFA